MAWREVSFTQMSVCAREGGGAGRREGVAPQWKNAPNSDRAKFRFTRRGGRCEITSHPLESQDADATLR